LTVPLRQGILSECGSVSHPGSMACPRRTSCTPCATRYAGLRCDEDLTTLIGPAGDGGLLEIGVLDVGGDDPVVVQAMALRAKFYRFLK
jgi:hypothetical protein